MKKLLSMFVVFVMLMTVLVGCGDSKPEGEYYSADLGFSIIFKDDVLVMDMMGVQVECEYEIDGDKITIITNGEEETEDFSFEDDVVTIGGDEFVKLKEGEKKPTPDLDFDLDEDLDLDLDLDEK